MGYVQFNLPDAYNFKVIPIKSLEEGDWHVKWSGLIECIDPTTQQVHGGMYVYSNEVPIEAEHIFSLKKEQIKVDIVVQPYEQFFKVQISMKDLKGKGCVYISFITTAKSVQKYTDIVKATHTTWLFIRTGTSIFHSRIRMEDSVIQYSTFSALQ
jgi:hypothetical protein